MTELKIDLDEPYRTMLLRVQSGVVLGYNTEEMAVGVEVLTRSAMVPAEELRTLQFEN